MRFAAFYDLRLRPCFSCAPSLTLSYILVLNLLKVFSDYGYEPKKGVAAVAGQGVTGSKGNRVYYKRPAADQAPVSVKRVL